MIWSSTVTLILSLMETLLNDIEQYAVKVSVVLLGLELCYVTNADSQLSGQHFPTPLNKILLYLPTTPTQWP